MRVLTLTALPAPANHRLTISNSHFTLRQGDWVTVRIRLYPTRLHLKQHIRRFKVAPVPPDYPIPFYPAALDQIHLHTQAAPLRFTGAGISTGINDDVADLDRVVLQRHGERVEDGLLHLHGRTPEGGEAVNDDLRTSRGATAFILGIGRDT